MMNFHKLRHDNEILYRPEDIEVSYKCLEPGIYLIKEVNAIVSSTITFRPITADNLIAFSEGVIKTFLKEVDSFFDPETVNTYRDLKMKHSTGYILYGKPGTGKTCLSVLAMSELAKKYKAVCLDMTKITIGRAKQLIHFIRNIQPNPIVLFADECDVDFAQHENQFLPFLDGNETIEDLIFIGCTNNINRIPERIKHRKSRIKKCFEIKSLPLKVYQEYLEERLPLLDKNLFSEICYKAMDKFLTIDQFKNALLDYKLHNLNIDQAIEASLETYKDEIHVEEDDE